MATSADKGVISTVAWSLFRLAEPENLGVPDPQHWSMIYLPRAEEMLVELSLQGVSVVRDARAF
jgi:hypothetical protein